MSLTTGLSLIGFPSLFVAALSVMATKLKHNNDMTKATQLGVQALLRDRLYKIYSRCKDRGYATLSERENFENLYTQYHSLGANGVMDDIRSKLLALEVEDDLL